MITLTKQFASSTKTTKVLVNELKINFMHVVAFQEASQSREWQYYTEIILDGGKVHVQETLPEIIKEIEENTFLRKMK